MKNNQKIIAFIAAAVCAVSFASCGKLAQEQTEPEKANDTLVVGINSFEGQFSPFYAKNAADTDVCAMTSVPLLTTDREGSIILQGIEGQSVSYNGTPYTYTGISNCAVQINDDGTVTYAFTLRKGVYFSDGEELNADDVIFSMYVLCDPAYDGPNNFTTLPILGLQEYKSGMAVLADLIVAAGEENTDFTYWTKEQQDLYWQTLKTEAGPAFAQEIVDYCIANGHAKNVNEAMEAWGHGAGVKEGQQMTAADFFAYLSEAYGYVYADFSETESAGTSLFAFAKELASKKDPVYATAVRTGQTAQTITGIVRTGDDSLTVTLSSFDAAAIYKLAIAVAPMHYYGQADQYNYESGQFGFAKGDLTHVKAQTSAPIGAGPYRMVSAEGGVISFEANENYYKGQPKIPFIKFREAAQPVEGVKEGTLDIAEPSLTAEIVEAVKGANGGSLTGDVITYDSVDFNGYGYIGICAKNVLVGSDAGSDASKNLRKAFATLFSVYRQEQIEAYYAEMATVIEYPISSTSWAAPRTGDVGYETAFSKDVNGEALYTEQMTAQQKEQAAKQGAIGFLQAAGYTFDEAAQKFTAAPYGAKMAYTIIIPGNAQADHPAFGIAQKAKEALATIGITLNISDPADAQEMWTALDSGRAEMWAAAFGETLDPDMAQNYASENLPTNEGGTGRNTYFITDNTLDQLMSAARASSDTAYRKDVYRDCLNMIMDWAVEVPTYQRQDAFIFSTQRIKTDTLPADVTPFYTWLSAVEAIELS